MDPFSAAAGAFSVISLAIQLVEKIQEVRDFWRSIEEASTGVGDLLRELDCILGILGGVAELEAISGLSNNEALLRALQACGIHVRRLSACVHDLKSGFGAGKSVRALTSLRFTLRREQIRTSQEALERAKTCLLLAQMLSQEQARVQDRRFVHESIARIGSTLLEIKAEKAHAVVVRRLSTDVLEESSSSFGDRPVVTTQHNRPRMQSEPEDGRDPFYKRPVREPETASSRLISRSKRKTALASFQQNTYMTVLANVHYQSRTINLEPVFEDDKVDRQQQFETLISVHPKPWLLGRGFALSYSTSGNSWIPQFGFQFRHYNIRPVEALMFEFCFFGNIDGVKSLLRRGDASPFDCDPEGWTPLHYAAQGHNHAICRLLIQHGASGSVLDLWNRSALHSALDLSPWAIREFRHSGSPAPSRDLMNSHLAQTVRILVEYTDIDLSAESMEGITFLDRVIQNRAGRALVGWLSQKSSTEFDVDHRNAEGKTLLMQHVLYAVDMAGCLTNMKNLLALGADLEARVLARPNTSPRDIGATALHFAAEIYHRSPTDICHRLPTVLDKRARYLLSQGANPHAITSSGHTATDRILEQRSIDLFLHWRQTLVGLRFDLKAFLRAEIEAHADVLWYASSGCDEFLLDLFRSYKPKPDDATSSAQILALFKAIADIEPEQDEDISPIEEDETTFNLFDDTDSEPEHEPSLECNDQSADEDISRPRCERMVKSPEVSSTTSRAVITGTCLQDDLSQYRSAKPESTKARRIWQAYCTTMFPTGDLKRWTYRNPNDTELKLESYGWFIASQSDYVSQ